MPAFSLFCPSFLHFRRPPSRSQKSYPSLIVHDGDAALPSPPTDRPSSVLGVPEQAMPGASGFIMQPPHFIDNNVNTINYTNTINDSNRFMEQLMRETIPGAEFDSSARDPPPRCHPGTRLATLEQCLNFIAHCSGVKKMRWVFGAAGVGKSAIMQSVAESQIPSVALQASVFFFINERNDATKAIITISYQLAARFEQYRYFIQQELRRDPTLVMRSMAVQFTKFIVEPFIHSYLNDNRTLIIIDGLDECNDTRAQVELLRLISDFCVQYPSSSIVWLIASRPEPHIASFFARLEVAPAYEREEIAVDSEEARADVERYLRHELTDIKRAYDSLDLLWPKEQDLWKLASAAGGLFAYAHAAIRYINDPEINDPVSQLSDVLNVIDRHPMADVSSREHPLASLDALYARILSKVPSKFLANTRKLVLALAIEWDQYLLHDSNLILLGNWLGMTPDEVYAAINRLHSVLRVPSRNKCHEEKLIPFHNSFIDCISDFPRSGFSADIQRESQQIKTECAFRVLKDAPNGIDLSDVGYGAYHGTLTHAPDTGDSISLTWLANEDQWREGHWNDNMTRLGLYNLAVAEVAAGMARGDPIFRSEYCIHLLTARFQDWGFYFPYYSLRDAVFDDSRRDEFMMQGILKKIPLSAIDASSTGGFLNDLYDVKLNFSRAVTTEVNLSDRWHQSCAHKRREGEDQNWATTFKVGECNFCSNRLRRQLEIMNAQSSDCTVPILFTSSGNCCLEFRFVDQEDGMAEWTYWFWYTLSREEREKYGSNV